MCFDATKTYGRNTLFKNLLEVNDFFSVGHRNPACNEGLMSRLLGVKHYVVFMLMPLESVYKVSQSREGCASSSYNSIALRMLVHRGLGEETKYSACIVQSEPVPSIAKLAIIYQYSL
jgi:hypothetical protein